MIPLPLSHIFFYAVLTITACFVFLLGVRNPFWVLCIMVLFLPLESLYQLSPIFTITKALGIFLFLVWLLHILFQKEKIYYTKHITIAIGFLLYMSLSIIWAFYQHIAPIITLLMLTTFLFLVPQMVDTKEKLEVILIFYLLGVLIGSIFCVSWLITHPGRRIEAIADSGHLPALFSLGIFYTLLKGVYPHKYGRSFPWLILCIGIVFITLGSGTRSSLFAFASAGLFLLIMFHLTKRFASVVFFGLSLILGWFVVKNYTHPRLLERFSKGRVLEGIQGRKEVWKIGLIEIMEHPVRGVGIGNSALLASEYYSVASVKYGIIINFWLSSWNPPSPLYPSAIRDIHNAYITAFAEGGIIGFSLLLWLILSLVKSYFSTIRKTPPGSPYWRLGLTIGAFFFFVLTTGLSEPDLMSKYFWFSFSLIIAFERIVGRTDVVNS
jgi:O-antigen ligase